MVPSLYRALKREIGDKDIVESFRFNTQLFDIFEFFKPNGGSPHARSVHITCILKAIFLPVLGLKKCYNLLHPDDKLGGLLYPLFGQIFIVLWFALHVAEASVVHMYVLAWLAYLGFVCILMMTRLEMRQKYNIWGSPVDDIVAAMFAWPLCLAQCEMMAMNNGEGAPRYLACIDEICEQMAQAKGAALPAAEKSTETNKV